MKMSEHELLAWFQTNFPEYVKSLHSCTHHYENNINPYHIEGDCWSHTLLVYKQVMNMHWKLTVPDGDYLETYDYEVLLVSALCHDLGKPLAKVIDEEQQKTKFHKHEQYSWLLSIPVVKKLVECDFLTKLQAEYVTKIVSLHSTLFDCLQNDEFSKKLAIEKYKDDPILLNYVKFMSIADAGGRFYLDNNKRGDFAIFEDEIDECITSDELYSKELTYYQQNSLVLLVGLPCSGKDTFLKNMKEFDTYTVISRDDILMKYGKDNGLGVEYSEIWNNLKEFDQEEIDRLLNEKFQDAARNCKDIVINMTNMSQKSRNRFTKNPLVKKYCKEAYVFLVDLETLKERNKQRYNSTGKNIPESVFMSMTSRFKQPMLSEFDSVHTIFGE